MNSYRVLVCGGREFGDRRPQPGRSLTKEEMELNRIEKEWLYRELDKIADNQFPQEIFIIQGTARGADTLSREWAEVTGCKHSEDRYKPDWNKYGKAAGPLRNAQMLAHGLPDLVVVFPGGRGTDNMANKAIEGGMRVLDLRLKSPEK